MLSNVLRAVGEGARPLSCTMVALSYRGFWVSSGKPSQYGIEQDAAAAIQFASKMATERNAKLVLWGQSLGAGVAAATMAKLASQPSDDVVSVQSLILETPFTSIRDMLVSLYPQRWLPYRYLWPFLRNWWDNEQALESISRMTRRPNILIVAAGSDEVVSPEHGESLLELCHRLDLEASYLKVNSALHHEVLLKAEGVNAVSSFLKNQSGSNSRLAR